MPLALSTLMSDWVLLGVDAGSGMAGFPLSLMVELVVSCKHLFLPRRQEAHAVFLREVGP
jgi:hypothetical protein